jgi:hypothetical protein
VNGPRAKRGRGGRGGYEPRLRIRNREARAVELALQGCRQSAIAADLRVSQAAVSKILARVEDRVLADQAAHHRQMKGRLMMRLEHLYGECIRAWERSKSPSTRRRQRQLLGSPKGSSGNVAELVTEDQSGDPRHLKLALVVLMAQIKLCGLDASPAAAPAVTPDRLAHLTDDEVWAKMEQARKVILDCREAECRERSEPEPAPTEDRGEADQRALREAYARELEQRGRRRPC